MSNHCFLEGASGFLPHEDKLKGLPMVHRSFTLLGLGMNSAKDIQLLGPAFFPVHLSWDSLLFPSCSLCTSSLLTTKCHCKIVLHQGHCPLACWTESSCSCAARSFSVPL